MKRGSTIFLRAVVIVMGVIVLALCIFAAPAISRGIATEYPRIAYLQGPILAGMYLSAIPFFGALYQTLKLLSYIDKNKAFSNLSITALKYIKYCALMISAVYALGLWPLYHIVQAEDAPGLLVMGIMFTFVPVVIATFAAVLQSLIQNAVDIKSENDLTV